MRISDLTQCGLSVDRAALWESFLPFTLPETPENDAVWREGAHKRRMRVVKALGRKLLGKPVKVSKRTETFVKGFYGPRWAEIGYGHFDPQCKPDHYAPWLWGNRQFLGSSYGAPRYRHLLIAAAIEKLKPRSVLEVGCGTGINLVLLANRFPKINFAGIELTDSGPALYRELKASDMLPDSLARYAPLPPRDSKGFMRVEVCQGSGGQIDYPDDSFDLVFSVLALEQMERIREKALSEMARASARWTLMHEPFRDVNSTFWRRLNVMRHDFFRGRIDDLPKYGLQPVFATDDFPQQIHLGACMVLCRKIGSDADPAKSLGAQ